MSDVHGIARTTSSLNAVANDTGRVAFCGPYVLSAITGYPVSRVEDVIREHRDIPAHRKPVVRGTYSDEVEAALQAFGYDMVLKESFMHVERKTRPSLWGWMQKPRNAWAHYILAIHKGKEGHWILVKGVKMCDTFTEGKWTFVVDGPHRGCRIMEVFEVKRSLDLDVGARLARFTNPAFQADAAAAALQLSQDPHVTAALARGDDEAAADALVPDQEVNETGLLRCHITARHWGT